MLEALARSGLSNRSLASIKSIYKAPKFTTRGPEDHTASGQCKSGIRQGCPLSPYLFILTLNVILYDLEESLREQGQPMNSWSVQYPTFDLEYADDTLLLALTTPQLQKYLTALEDVALEYGMHLNQQKTEVLVQQEGDNTPLTFKDGAPVPTTPQIKYLGSMISWKHPFETAFYHRKGLSEQAYKKLRLVWNSSMAQKRKLGIFQATFLPVLTYGLDALTITEKQLHRLDAHYIRFLRRIVGVKASYYSHVTNQAVYNKAKHPKLPSDIIAELQFKMLQEVYSTPQESPLHNVVFSSANKDRILYQGRRRGMPFPYWIDHVTRTHFPGLLNHTAPKNPHWRYILVKRALQKPLSELAPKRAQTKLQRERPP